MVGHAALDRVIGVRIPASQPSSHCVRIGWSMGKPWHGILVQGYLRFAVVRNEYGAGGDGSFRFDERRWLRSSFGIERNNDRN